MNTTTLELMPIKRSYIPFEEITSTARPFIEANTLQSSLQEIKSEHIIPVFKDNEPVISHSDFIETVMSVANDIFPLQHILSPNIRLSHPIQGRVPSAKNKLSRDLLDHEKTLHYERMAFVIEIPSVTESIGGNQISLTIGGVKAYNLDNLSLKKGTGEVFKVFIGFQNKVCTNLAIWSDGYKADLKVRSIEELKNAIYCLFNCYNIDHHIKSMKTLTNCNISEQQFVQLIGRCKLYQYLPPNMKANMPFLAFGDTQISSICKDYYRDKSFCRNDDGSINLWKVYNLFTEANKSSYIDTFLDRSVNAFQFIEGIKNAVKHNQANWFLQ
jgi:hypothetical protein